MWFQLKVDYWTYLNRCKCLSNSTNTVKFLWSTAKTYNYRYKLDYHQKNRVGWFRVIFNDISFLLYGPVSRKECIQRYKTLYTNAVKSSDRSPFVASYRIEGNFGRGKLWQNWRVAPNSPKFKFANFCRHVQKHVENVSSQLLQNSKGKWNRHPQEIAASGVYLILMGLWVRVSHHQR